MLALNESMKYLFLLLSVACGLVRADEPDVGEVVRRSAANDGDFEAQSHYSHMETDSTGRSSKTFRVWMLDGIPYRELASRG